MSGLLLAKAKVVRWMQDDNFRRAADQLGNGYRLTDWLLEQTTDRPNKSACGAIMPDLVELL
jgi:hypothetical protein